MFNKSRYFLFIIDNNHTKKLLLTSTKTPEEHLVDIAFLSTCKIYNTTTKSFQKNNETDIIYMAEKLKIKLLEHHMDMIITGSVASMLCVPPRITHNLDVQIRPLYKTKLQIICYNDFYFINGLQVFKLNPEKYTTTFYGWDINLHINKHTPYIFSRSKKVNNLQFAPLEYMCYCNVINTSHYNYLQDVSDILYLDLDKFLEKSLDFSWIKKQLSENKKALEIWNELNNIK